MRDPIAPASRTTLYGSAISRVLVQGYAQPIRGLIWYQGESDTTQAVDVYRTALGTFVADLRGDLANPGLFVAICQLSWAATSPERQDGWMRIREAQRQYVSSDPRSVLVATIDLPNDGLHLFGPGHREAGRRLGLATLRASYGLRSDATPRLRWTRLQRGASRITLKYDRRLIGGNPMHFGVLDAGVGVATVAVTTRGSRVKIDLERAVGTGARVTYSAGSNGNAPVDPIVGARGEGAVPLFQDLGVGLRLP
jgi:hypothetical protein